MFFEPQPLDLDKQNRLGGSSDRLPPSDSLTHIVYHPLKPISHAETPLQGWQMDYTSPILLYVLHIFGYTFGNIWNIWDIWDIRDI